MKGFVDNLSTEPLIDLLELKIDTGGADRIAQHSYRPPAK